MKNQLNPAQSTELPSEAEVRRYLAQNPDFFERNAVSLETLELKHACVPAASLIERQVQQLRSRSQQLELKLQELLRAAGNNDRLAEALQQLALGLFKAKSVAAALSLTEDLLKQQFLADQVVVRLQVEMPKRTAKKIQHYFVAEAENWIVFEDLLLSGRIVCGQLLRDQLRFFSLHGVPQRGSYALMPLLSGERILGVMMIGSHDPDRFSPTMGVDFLNHFSQLLAGRLAQFFK
ncbi:MAG: DUF484 family protein [Gammaproteobacteria bacterium]|nr:DUF484 family protein [Gammaproteobacteria bacterium]